MPAGPSDSLYFSEQFRVSPQTLADYGAFDISVVSNLPLFIDPFLLFQSNKPEYAALHEGIAAYLRFLRDRSPDGLDDEAMRTYYRFEEVKQNWRAVVNLRASFGSGAAGLVSFTLAKSSGLKRRLQKAGRASGAVTVVLAYAADVLASAAAIVDEVASDGSVVLVDAS